MINFKKIVSVMLIVTALASVLNLGNNTVFATTKSNSSTVADKDKKDLETDKKDSETSNSLDENKKEEVYSKTTKKKVVIKKKTVVKKRRSLPKGYKKVLKKGRNGVMLKIVTKTYSGNTNELLSTDKKTKIIKKAKKRVVLKGTRPVVSKINRGSSRLDDVKKSFKVTATAYTYTGNNTATGKKPKEGYVAVDPKVIPLGSLLYIKSLDGGKDYGYCIAADTGGAIKGKKVDLFFNTRRECILFGRRKVKVLVLRYGK